MWNVTRLKAQDAKFSSGYWWAWYYGHGFMDDMGNYVETYNRNHPALKQSDLLVL